jgi:hypothetical protein
MLNWRTYGALPVLRSYAAALAHWEKTTPIRGDANGTKPVGRRDQKWLSIYKRETDNAVCIGSFWGKEKGRALLAYHPDGRVDIESHISASCRERIQRIAGLNIQRKNYEDWVTAVAHVDGKEVVGHYPLQLRYNGDRKATFILRDMASHIYLNPVPVYKHTINRKAKAELTKQYKPFMDYMEAMAKLSADPTQHSPWSKESMDNPRLPTVGNDDRRELFAGMPNRWEAEGPPALLKLVESGETENWYKAMMWLGNGHWRKLLSEAKTDMVHMVHQQHRDVLFIKERVAAGKCVQDRYGQYFR